MIGVFWFLVGGRDIASSRLQGYLIDQALQELGYSSTIIYAPKCNYIPDLPGISLISNLCDLQNSVSVIQKLRGDNTDRLCNWLRSRGSKIVYVNCDLEDSNRSWLNADQLIVTTNGLRDYHSTLADLPITRIDEPYEFLSLPKAKPLSNEGITALWFGNRRNWAPLVPWKTIIESQFKGKVRLITCSDHPDATCSWSFENQKRLLLEADIVLLPTASDDDFRVKSANRLIQAMAVGLPAIIGPLEAFRQVCQTQPVAIEVADEIQFRDRLNDLLCQARRLRLANSAYAYVVDRFAPRTIARQWIDSLGLRDPSPRQRSRYRNAYRQLKIHFNGGIYISKTKRKIRNAFGLSG